MRKSRAGQCVGVITGDVSSLSFKMGLTRLKQTKIDVETQEVNARIEANQDWPQVWQVGRRGNCDGSKGQGKAAQQGHSKYDVQGLGPERRGVTDG